MAELPEVSDEEHNALLEYQEDGLLSYSSRNHQSRAKTSYEEAIAKTGYGIFHYLLLALCGWALSSDAIEILSISFILPPATDDLHLTDTMKGWLNSSIFLGMMIGGYLWGTLADIKGRRAILLWSLSINALGGLGSSFAQTYWLFVLLRLLSGIGVGGSMPVIFTYFTEFQPKEIRGAMISLLATFWMCGNILAAALAWIVIPRQFEWIAPGFHYTPWRLYLALCIVPSFTSVLLFVLMPESPKFLMENDKEQEAIRVLNRIYSSNHKKRGQEATAGYMVTALEVHTPEVAYVYPDNGRACSKFPGQCCQFMKSTIDLFRPPLLSLTLIMLIISVTIMFGYYGLFMWLPEMFAQMEKYGGSVCHPGTPSNTTSLPPTSDVSSTIYLESFIIALANLPGNIFSIFLMDKIGRKALLVGSMILSGICVFFIWFVKTKTLSLVVTCLFSGISVVGFVSLDVLCAELFPTNVRSTATGLQAAIGRIAAIFANLLFGSMLRVNCAVPILVVAVLLWIGGLMALKLPNTIRADLL